MRHALFPLVYIGISVLLGACSGLEKTEEDPTEMESAPVERVPDNTDSDKNRTRPDTIRWDTNGTRNVPKH